MAQRLCLGCMEKINDKYVECPYCGYIDGTPAKEACHIEPGNVLAGKYIVGRVIGFGGFGVTYVGYDGLLEKKIAIKEYLPSEFATRMPGQTEVTVYSGERQEQFYSGIDKFVEEAKRLAQFKEVSGVVRIFDSFTENKTAYIIMEYLEGETLKERLNREGKLEVEDSLNIIMPVLDALKEVHNIGIIHRDIAPDNIFLTNDGKVKLLDFGAARYATTTHSKSLSVIIKQGYAPEEQYRSKGDQGPWTDVYACGATLYKMLTGITPEDSMERAGKDNLQPPSKHGVKVSKNLDVAIMNAMNIRIEDRTQSAEEFKEELLSVNEVKRKKAHERKMDIGKWPLWVKLVSGIAAGIILTFGILLATNVIHFDMKQIMDTGLLASNETYVPNVVNYSVNEAEEKILARHLVLQIIDKQNSDVIPRDKILSQNITDGQVVEAETVIEIVVSAGGEIVYLEEIEGLSQEDATLSLENLGLNVEVVEEESDIAPGCVIRYEAVKDGEALPVEEGVEKGTTIRLYISKGRSDVDENVDTQVPNVVGMNYASASEKVRDAGLYIYRIRGEYSSNVPAGQIISQNMTAGSTVKQGSSIGVVVSLGIQTTRVPDVQYKDMNTAVSLLSSNNLTYECQYEDSTTVAENHVSQQSIPAGSEVNLQTKVILIISNGNPNVNVGNPTVVADNNTQSNTTTEAKNPPVSTNNTQSNPGTEAKNPPASTSSTQANSGTEAKNPPASTSSTQSNPGTETSASQPFKVSVPNLVGSSKTEAERMLKNAGLRLGNIEYRSRVGTSNGTVLWQSTSSGSQVARNSEIRVIVCDNSTKTETYTEYQEVIKKKETTESTASSLSGWTRTGYHYSGWGETRETSNRQVGSTYDGSVVVSEIWAGPLPTYYTVPTQNWRIGKSGQPSDEVRWIQRTLNNDSPNRCLAEDGIYGEATAAEVKGVQSAYGLAVDGEVGPQTLTVLKSWYEGWQYNNRKYYCHEKTKIYEYERYNTSYGSWSTTKPASGNYNTRTNTRTVYVYDAY